MQKDLLKSNLDSAQDSQLNNIQKDKIQNLEIKNTEEVILNITEDNKEEIKNSLNKEVMNIYKEVFIPAFKELAEFKLDLEKNIKIQKFGNMNEKLQAKKLAYISDFLSEFTEEKIGARVNSILNEINSEFNIIIDEAANNETKDSLSHIEKVIEAIFNIYLEIQEAKVNLMDKVLSDEK